MDLIILIVLICAGYILTKQGILNTVRVSWGNKWIIYVALPAVALLKVPSLEISSELITPLLSPVIVFFGSVATFYLILRKWLQPQERLVLALLGGLGNTSFMGYPFISFFYEPDDIKYALVLDQVNFLLLATAAQYMLVSSEGSFSLKNSFKQIVFFPPFLALIVAFFIPPGMIQGVSALMLEKLTQTISPVAMLIVGFQIARFVSVDFTRPLLYGIFYKLAIAPLLVLLLLFPFHSDPLIFKITVFESGMAPMITIGIIVTDKEILPKLAAQFLCWGIIFSFLTVPVWYWILEKLIQ